VPKEVEELPMKISKDHLCITKRPNNRQAHFRCKEIEHQHKRKKSKDVKSRENKRTEKNGKIREEKDIQDSRSFFVLSTVFGDFGVSFCVAGALCCNRGSYILEEISNEMRV